MPSFADEVIKSHGVVLRPLTEADVPAIAIACSDAQTQQWLPLPRPYTEDAARSYALGSSPLEWCNCFVILQGFMAGFRGGRGGRLGVW